MTIIKLFNGYTYPLLLCLVHFTLPRQITKSQEAKELSGWMMAIHFVHTVGTINATHLSADDKEKRGLPVQTGMNQMYGA
jgi:hypothetical protein